MKFPLRWRKNTDAELAEAKSAKENQVVAMEYDTTVFCPWCGTKYQGHLKSGVEYTKACQCGCEFDYGTFAGKGIIHTRPIQVKR